MQVKRIFVEKKGTHMTQLEGNIPLSEQAYTRLRDQLRQGQFIPGQRLIENEICDLFSMSRTPVREALRRLQSEGLLDSSPGGRIVVSEIDLPRIEEIYDMRESVEGLAARLAARNARTPDLMQLDLILDEQRAGVDDEAEFLRINDKFHIAIYNLSQNRYVQQMGEVLLSSTSMVRGSTRGRYDYTSTSLAEHELVFAAIREGDTARAEAAMKAHVRHGRWQRIRLLDMTA